MLMFFMIILLFIQIYIYIYNLSMVALSWLTIDIFLLIPSWNDFFKDIKLFIECFLKSKMAPTGTSYGYYGNMSSIGRKNVCSMNNNSSDYSASDNGEESETEKLIIKTDKLRARIYTLNWTNANLNNAEIRNIAYKLDNGLPLTSQEREKWQWVIYDLVRYPFAFLRQY